MITWGLGIEHEIKCMFQQKKKDLIIILIQD